MFNAKLLAPIAIAFNLAIGISPSALASESANQTHSPVEALEKANLALIETALDLEISSSRYIREHTVLPLNICVEGANYKYHFGFYVGILVKPGDTVLSHSNSDKEARKKLIKLALTEVPKISGTIAAIQKADNNTAVPEYATFRKRLMITFSEQSKAISETLKTDALVRIIATPQENPMLSGYSLLGFSLRPNCSKADIINVVADDARPTFK